MKKEMYQKPEYKFSDLYLFDGVAATCWGYGHVTVRVFKDTNRNNLYDTGEQVLVEEKYSYSGNDDQRGHCNDVAGLVSAGLADAQAKYPEYYSYFETVSTRTNSDVVDSALQDFPIHS